ncbi:LacI family DNA-binding transcriptional regulator [Pontibacter sp. SGAir0037]|uniref:LacI family DNA-binding transcriptional regulator n=1 Tax=Pontibacter sp. SGAir0037 TaxID=2571030 RepID=UPI0010CD1DBC|nr:substrate-binding domain-containing protein [Pontibacter sp. SGAir0037]QCR21154.1 LacI family transcriptional regulator [Pontibacter sp. SGAir0037]
MKKKKLSIRDIASQLNISITTVSFILNGKAKEKRISEDLTNKVLNLVKEVGYKPNQIAQSLRTGKTKIIGLMVEDISNVFFSNVARLIEENAHKKGYKIIYCSTENNPEKARELINMFRDWNIDGYIITPPAGIEDEIQSLISDNYPVILFDRYYTNLKTNYVVIDNYESTYRAITHLIEQGYKDIAFITLDSRQSQMEERLRGYKKALADHKLKPYVKRLAFDESKEKNVQQIASYLKKQSEVDAIFTATNYIGTWGIEAIQNLDTKGKGRYGLASFDDHDIFKLYNPPITAVAQPVEEISQAVIKMVLDQLEDSSKAKAVETITLPAKLIVRGSSLSRTDLDVVI